MRQPCGDEKSNLTERGFWLALLDRQDEQLRTRAAAKLAEEPEVPTALAYLHAWWQELDAGRRYGMNGPEPIAYMDIDAWVRLTDAQPTARDVSAIVLMDRTVLNPGRRVDGTE